MLSPAQVQTAARHRLTVAVGALALAAAVAACGSQDPNAVGPLGGPESSGTVCMTDVHSEVLTDGWPVVGNTSKTPAVIDKVSLAKPMGMSLITAWAVPITGHTAYGAEPGYPPGKDLPPGIAWARRHSAVAAIVPHSAAPHETDLLFVVRILAPRASVSGFNIWYHVGSQHWHIQTVFGLRVLTEGSCS
jgi:hypothetical protein